MSARHIQRLGKALQTKDHEDEVEEEPSDVETKRQTKAFTALAAFDSDDDDDDSRSDASQKERVTPHEAVEAPKLPSGRGASAKSKKKKNKKKDRKAEKAEESFLEDMAKAALAENQTDHENKDEINRLAFDTNHLDPDREVQRKLGKALASATSARAVKPRVPRGARLVLPPGVTTTDRTHLPRFLVIPDDNWLVPPTFVSGEGARMIRLNDNVFTFEASESYRAAQEQLRELSRTHQPQLIMDFSQTHPFHVDALLQLVDVFTASSQNESAHVLLRTALYTLESWCSPAFRTGLGNGENQLNLPLEEYDDEFELLRSDGGVDAGLNGAFLRALAQAMRVAGRRDCFETAFNLAKMCWSLCPERDPCYIQMAVDYYALMAKQNEFVLNAHSEADLEALPCVIYGQSLAMFNVTRANDSSTPHSVADDLLRRACGRFPQYAEMILAKAGRDIPPILAKRLSKGCREVEERLCRLSITRQETLWSHDKISWVYDTLRRTSKELEYKEDFPFEVHEAMAKYARCSALDLSDKVEHIPQDEIMADEEARRRFVPDQPPRNPDRANVNLDLNDMLLFLQTMMPWARLPGDTGDAGDQEDGDEWEGEDVN